MKMTLTAFFNKFPQIEIRELEITKNLEATVNYIPEILYSNII